MFIDRNKERRAARRENENPNIIIFKRRAEKKAKNRHLEKIIRELEQDWGHGKL